MTNIGFFLDQKIVNSDPVSFVEITNLFNRTENKKTWTLRDIERFITPEQCLYIETEEKTC